jgi:hypothetical protein
VKEQNEKDEHSVAHHEVKEQIAQNDKDKDQLLSSSACNFTRRVVWSADNPYVCPEKWHGTGVVYQ